MLAGGPTFRWLPIPTESLPPTVRKATGYLLTTFREPTGDLLQTASWTQHTPQSRERRREPAGGWRGALGYRGLPQASAGDRLVTARLPESAVFRPEGSRRSLRGWVAQGACTLK